MRLVKIGDTWIDADRVVSISPGHAREPREEFCWIHSVGQRDGLSVHCTPDHAVEAIAQADHVENMQKELLSAALEVIIDWDGELDCDEKTREGLRHAVASLQKHRG